MNPLMSFLRSPQGKALAQHALEAAGQHLIEMLTKGGTAGAAVERVDPPIEEQRQRVNMQMQGRQYRARSRYAQDVHIKEADVLDVRVEDAYKCDPNTDPDAP